MTSTKPPTEENLTANADDSDVPNESPKPSPRLPEPDGCTVEEFLEAFPRILEKA